MAAVTFTLNWDNSLVLASGNSINQRVSYRQKNIGDPWITVGFTPNNDLSTSDTSAYIDTLDPNLIYEFKVEAICTEGGPTINDNGIVEQIVFQCIDPDEVTATQTTATIIVDFTATDITKARWRIRRSGDDSLVQSAITTVSNSTSHTFTGLVANTSYYITVEYYTTINFVEVISSASNYLDDVCGRYNITTNAVAVPNLVFSWNRIDANASVNLTSNINGSYSSVDWGDGTINTLLTHTYSSLPDNFTVKIYDSTATIIDLSSKFLTAFTALPTTVVHLDVQDNSIPSLPSLTPNTSLIYLDTTKNPLTSFPDFSSNILLEELYMKTNNIAGSYDFSLNTELVYIQLGSNSITGLTGFLNAPSIGLLTFESNGVSVTDINNALVALDTNGVTNGIFSSSTQSPLAAPTGLGAIAKANLISKGWTIATD